MSQSFFVDTSFVVALVSRRDEYREVAHRIYRRFLPTDKFYYTDAIVFESLNTLSKGENRRLGLEFFDRFAASDNAELIHTTPQQFYKALDLFERHPDKEWSLVDCVSFLVMQSKQIAFALTSDGHFEQVGYIALLRNPELMA
jgi:uncharacterized protein